MGITIEQAIMRYKNNAEFERVHDSLQGYLEFKQLAEWLEQYQKLKAEYEARLKADMVAMLTDIQLEIEELDLKDFVPDYQKGADETREYVADLLQQKIDALKEIEPQKSEDNNADMREAADETN